MDFEKFSDRLKGFVQSAQTVAIREGNPQITPEHLLKVLLDDPEGLAAGLIAKAGGRPEGGAGARRGGARQAAQGVGRRGSSAYGAGTRPRARPGGAVVDQGRRQLRHRRARAAGTGHGQGDRGLRAFSPTPASRRSRSMPPSTSCARAAPRIWRPPSRPMTR